MAQTLGFKLAPVQKQMGVTTLSIFIYRLWFDAVRRHASSHTFLTVSHTHSHTMPYVSVGVWMYSITGFYQPSEISLHSSSLSHTHAVYFTHLTLIYYHLSLVLFLFCLSFICLPVSVSVHFLALFYSSLLPHLFLLHFLSFFISFSFAFSHLFLPQPCPKVGECWLFISFCSFSGCEH